MIREYDPQDLDTILNIWLEASVRAHAFVAAEFWESKVDDMRNIYIPASETYVFEQESSVLGFYALYGNSLAAIFVQPEQQGRGIGRQLIEHAKTKRSQLELTVYRENRASLDFYLAQGFKAISEQIDEHTGRWEVVMGWGA